MHHQQLKKKKSNPKEKIRVEQEGGSIMYGLLNDSLEVTRAFGDYEQSGEKLKGLSAIPEVRCYNITDDDDFLILACDGVWKGFTLVDHAITLVRETLYSNYSNPIYGVELASEYLVRKATQSISDDNATAIVVHFK